MSFDYIKSYFTPVFLCGDGLFSFYYRRRFGSIAFHLYKRDIIFDHYNGKHSWEYTDLGVAAGTLDGLVETVKENTMNLQEGH